ncbi:MAG: class I SAM-dependent methyltransferase [Bacteroidetes bacterium]|nr:class I SAM-dependent methyltransferase [Bacteroidota bacterium]
MKEITRDFDPNIFHPFYIIRRELKKKMEKFAPSLHGRLLDFGCGSKPYESLFQTEEYIGLDYYNEGHPHENENIDVFYDGKNFPFEDNHFDCILCSEVVEHIFNLPEILLEMNRVLKKDGLLLLTCPFVWNEHEVPFDFARYSQFALKSLLENAGFEIVRFEKSGNFILAITQLKVLYFYNHCKRLLGNFFLLRWIYKGLFVFIPNAGGLLLNLILPKDHSLYLNNIVLAKKK